MIISGLLLGFAIGNGIYAIKNNSLINAFICGLCLSSFVTSLIIK